MELATGLWEMPGFRVRSDGRQPEITPQGVELCKLGVRRSNAPEDHSSKSVKPKSRERYGNTEPSPGIQGEGVETGWRAPHVGEGTVRLSSKGESDRITQRSVVQIHPPQPTLSSIRFNNLAVKFTSLS